MEQGEYPLVEEKLNPWNRVRDRCFISFEYEGMHLNVRLIILELLEQC